MAAGLGIFAAYAFPHKGDCDMDIEEAGKLVNDADARLVPLFMRRTKASESIAAYKGNHNMPTRDIKRKQEFPDRVSPGVEESLKPYVRELYATLFSLSRRYQDALRSETSGLV